MALYRGYAVRDIYRFSRRGKAENHRTAESSDRRIRKKWPVQSADGPKGIERVTVNAVGAADKARPAALPIVTFAWQPRNAHFPRIAVMRKGLPN